MSGYGSDILRTAVVVVSVLAVAVAQENAENVEADAVEVSKADAPDRLVDQGNAAYAEGDFAGALELYKAAAEQLDGGLPELSFDLGAAEFKLGNDARAEEYFYDALSTKDRKLEAATKYNLGNCAYNQALGQAEAAPQDAVRQLKRATKFYHDSLQLVEGDADALKNIQLASRLIKQLEEMLEQQEQQQDQDRQDQQDEEQGDEEQEEEQQQSPSTQPQPSDEQQQDRQPEQDQQQEQEQSQQPEREQQQSQQEQAEDSAQQEMSREEAQRMLQAVRDKEKARREQNKRLRRARRVPVAKDW